MGWRGVQALHTFRGKDVLEGGIGGPSGAAGGQIRMDYNQAEQHLLRQLASGCRPAVPTGFRADASDVRFTRREDVPESALLRASALARILIDRAGDQTDLACGVQIRGYWIDGDLDLARAHRLDADAGRALVPLVAERCHIDGLMDLAGARAASIQLRDTSLAGLCARGADIAGGLTLDGCIIRSQAGGSGRTTSTSRRRHAEQGAGAAGRSAVGRIDLDGCAVGGDLNARGLRVDGDFADTSPRLEIDADNAVVHGSVDLGARKADAADTARCDASRAPNPAIYANFDNADIFGDFRASGAWFAPLQGAAGSVPPECLDLRGAQIRGDLCLEHVRASGRIRLEDADVAQDLELGGAQLVQPRGVALDAQGLVVHGSVHLVDRQATPRPAAKPAASGLQDVPARDPRLVAYGQLRFSRARIGGDFDGSGATVCAVDVSIEGVAIDLRSAEVGGSIYLDGRRDVGPGFFVGLINLIQIQVRGSIVFSGSWFRAPCGQIMGPERIDAELYSETDMRFVLCLVGEDMQKRQYREFSVADVYYGLEDRLPDGASNWPDMSSGWQLSEGVVGPLMRDLGITEGLAYDARKLWRLRGGCRAIALEDARVFGAVLFGTAIDIYAPPSNECARQQEPKPGPSVVVGAVDMDRIRIDGELRLTGGIFRAVTPIVSNLDEASADKPVDDVGDVSLSYPSTVGWTELMARTCLTLRGAQVGGRLDTRFFGALPPDVQSPNGPDMTACRAWRHRLNLVPEDAERLDGNTETWVAAEVQPHQKASAYASEMLVMLAYVSAAERAADHAYGATRPHVPDIQDVPGSYHLRPDGRFDLSDARLGAIHDHPAHGWPTSDGHVRLNGCSYEFITLDVEESRIDAPVPRPGEHDNAYSARLDRVWSTPTRQLTYAERTGESWWAALALGLGRGIVGLGLAIRQLVLSAVRIPERLVAFVRFLFARESAGSPACRTSGPGRKWQAVCMRRRALRYRGYARQSVKRRNDDRGRPAYRRIAWLEQQYPGAKPTARDFLPQPYETLCRVMRSNGYREDADLIAAAKRRQRCRATLRNPITLIGEHFLRRTSNYGYAPARVIAVTLLALAIGSATVQVAADHDLLAYESLQTEGVAVLNTVASAGPVGSGEVQPREDLELAPVLFALDRFVPVVEFGYAAEWSVAEWVPADGTSTGLPYIAQEQGEGALAPGPSWPDAVRSLMIFDPNLNLEDGVWLPDLFMLGGEMLRLPVAIVAWITGGSLTLIDCGLSWTSCEALGSVPEDGRSFDAPIQMWTNRDPETVLRWLGAIYHGLGWALVSMAIVTFTGVMRRD